MRRVHCLLPLTAAVLAAGVAACTRPVAGRDGGEVVITGIEVSPSFIRAGVPVQVLLQVAGPNPTEILGDLGGQPLACPGERRPDGRFECTLATVSPGMLPQGVVEAQVTVVDDGGAASVASTTATVDFDCPTIVSLSVSPDAGRPGTEISVTVESSEPLGLPPRLTRAGRSWGVPVAVTTTRYELSYPVSDSDPASQTDLVIQLTDRAGNTTTDCGVDGRRPVAIDHVAPSIDTQRMLLQRGAPGSVAVLSAEPGAIRDDVRVVSVNVYDADSSTLLASLEPEADGSLAQASLGGSTTGRVLVEAVDLLGRQSPRTAIAEEWSLSLGSGRSPNAGLGSAVRLTPPPADGAGLSDRTAELAPSVLAADGLRATILARMGFEPAGRLPNAYEDTIWIAGGYDEPNNTIVVFGGTKFLPATETNPEPVEYFDRTLIVRWDARSGTYQFTSGPVYQRGESPSRRGARKIAFNGEGCGLLFGGSGFRETSDGFFSEQRLNDAWQICHTPDGYQWRPVRPQTDIPTIRLGPVVYDPTFDRYVVVGGRTNASSLFAFDDVWFLEPGLTPEAWRWRELIPRPSNFPGRYSHLFYFDPQAQALAVGLGFVSPFSQASEWWLYQEGQLIQRGAAPDALRNRQGFDYAYDKARRHLVLWGDNDFPQVDSRVWLLTGTATNSPSGWRSISLDAPVPRAWPTLVYDSAREVMVTFGGQRFDDRFVPSDIYSLITPPAYPYLLARVDLAAARPKGAQLLELTIVARGSGDRDGVGPEQALGDGVRVLMFNRESGKWDEVARGTGEAPLTATLASPSRYISDAGVVPIAISTVYPGTEGLDAQLEVDAIDGRLVLRSNVTLP